MYVIYMHLSMLTGQTGLPPNQPTSLKVKNLHNFDIFKPICLKLGMETRNRKIPLMYLIYIHLGMLTGRTGVPPNWPIDL